MIKKLLAQSRPVLLGRVKLGAWERGKAAERFDEFKIAKIARGANNQMIEDIETRDFIKKSLKLKPEDKLRRIPIYFSGNTIDEVFDCCYEMRIGSRAFCVGDGEIARRAIVSVNKQPPKPYGSFEMPKKDDIKSVEITGWDKKDCCDKGCKTYDPNPDVQSKCKMSMNMLFHIQGLTRRGGLFEFRSHSLHTTRMILAGLKEFDTKLFGHLGLLPFELVLESKKTRSNREIWVAHLEMVGDLISLRHQAVENAQNEMKFIEEIKKYRVEEKKLLTALPEEISEADGEAATGEAYPEETKNIDVEVRDGPGGEEGGDDQLF